MSDLEKIVSKSSVKKGVRSDLSTFRDDDRFTTLIGNILDVLIPTLDYIQDKFIKEDKYTPSIICFSCKSLIDIAHEISGSTYMRDVGSDEVLTEIPEIFQKDIMKRLITNLILLTTRGMASSNTRDKDSVIRCIYDIKTTIINK